MSYRRRASETISDKLYLNFRANFPSRGLPSAGNATDKQAKDVGPATPAKTMNTRDDNETGSNFEEGQYGHYFNDVETYNTHDQHAGNSDLWAGEQHGMHDQNMADFMLQNLDSALLPTPNPPPDYYSHPHNMQHFRTNTPLMSGGFTGPFSPEIQNQQNRLYQEEPQLQISSQGPSQQHSYSQHQGYAAPRDTQFEHSMSPGEILPSSSSFAPLLQAHDISRPPVGALDTYAARTSQHLPSTSFSRIPTSPILDRKNSKSMLPANPTRQPSLSGQGILPPHPEADAFRFRVTLHNRTGITFNKDSVPVSYINKAVPYTVSVRDTQFNSNEQPRMYYRTFMRMTFDDPEIRTRPNVAWAMYRDHRGTQKDSDGNKFIVSAVEYAKPEEEDQNLVLEREDFDGFCIQWCSDGPVAACQFQLKINCLSTDFSASKGVKGYHLRLNAKTEAFSAPIDGTSPAQAKEFLYCMVQNFRDHGAERKLHLEIHGIDQKVKKLRNPKDSSGGTGEEDQPASASPPKQKGKRAHSGPPSEDGNPRPAKVRKQLSTGDSGTESSNMEIAEKVAKLEELKAYFHNENVFYVEASPKDDPDDFPLNLPEARLNNDDTESGQSAQVELKPRLSKEQSGSTTRSSMPFDSPMGRAVATSTHLGSTFAPPSRTSSNEWSNHPRSRDSATAAFNEPNPQQLASPADGPIRLKASYSVDGLVKEETLDVIDVDPLYRPPPDDRPKPVTCFYIKPQGSIGELPDPYYRAVYIYQRTIDDLIVGVAQKVGLTRVQISEVVKIGSGNSDVVVKLGDEDVSHMAEGVAMLVDFTPVNGGNEGDEAAGQQRPQQLQKYQLVLRY